MITNVQGENLTNLDRLRPFRLSTPEVPQNFVSLSTHWPASDPFNRILPARALGPVITPGLERALRRSKLDIAKRLAQLPGSSQSPFRTAWSLLCRLIVSG